MTKIKFLTAMLMLSLTLTAFAQNLQNSTTVKGTLIDSTSNKGEAFATVHIVRKEAPTVPVKMAVTDENGKFSEKINQRGDFIAIITLIGKTTVKKEFSITETDKTIDLGTLYTRDDVQQIGEAVVIAQKPLVKVDLDKIEYSIEDDPDSKTNTAIEMLRKVPLVTVDGEDKIQVNGSSSFKIHVNGKPNTMMSNNPSDVLKSMPASTIKKIEVITNPGAKYDAEGTSGILNIITIGGGIEGYTAAIRASATTNGIGGGTYLSVKSGKLTVSANYNYNSIRQPTQTSTSYRENYLSTAEKYLTASGAYKPKGNYHYGNVEASYEFDTLRLLSLSFGMYGLDYSRDGSEFTEMNDDNFQPVYRYSGKQYGKNSTFSINGNVDYQRSFKTKGRMLTFSYRTSLSPSSNDSYKYYSDEFNLPSWLGLQNRRTDGEQNTSEHTFQADYTTPIKKYHTVETGVKYILRNNESDNKYYTAALNSDNFQYDASNSSNYKHSSDILAAYAGHSYNYKTFSVKTGLRYEHTSQDVQYLLGQGSDFNVKFNDIVPSLSVGMKLGQTKNLRAGYNIRISRPSIYYLDPYVNDLNPMSIQYGNSNLKSEKRHSISLTYSSFTAKLSINLSLGYYFINNSIESVSFMKNNVQHTTYDNIGKINLTSMSMYANWNATPKTRVYFNSWVSYVDRSNPAGNQHNYGWEASLFGGVQHTLPLKIRLSLNGGGMTPGVNLQGRGHSYNYYGISLSRSFMKEDRLSLGVNAINIFHAYNKMNSTVQGADFFLKTSYKYQMRFFSFNISYRMGNLKASVKKASRTINNDDVKSGGNSESGSGGSSGGGGAVQSN